MRTLFAATLALAALCGASFASAQEPNSAAAPNSNCFYSSNWRSWSAPGDSNILLLRVRSNDIYRIELSPNTRVHKRPERFLVNNLNGGPWVCSALDLDLRLNDPQGFSQPLIARTLTRLSPEEVAAIPAEDLP
jgi:hypothetical protein